MTPPMYRPLHKVPLPLLGMYIVLILLMVLYELTLTRLRTFGFLHGFFNLDCVTFAFESPSKASSRSNVNTSSRYRHRNMKSISQPQFFLHRHSDYQIRIPCTAVESFLGDKKATYE